jgi:hypothetical protein
VFVWLAADPGFPHRVAVASVLDRDPGGEIMVVTDVADALRAVMGELARSVRFEPADERWFADPHLRARWRSTSSPIVRSNLLRLAVLARLGGVYRDFDTITVGTTEDLRRGAGDFVGTERLCVPATTARSRRIDRWLLAGLRMAVRRACVAHPRGHRFMHRWQGAFPLAVNNAVIGARPGGFLPGAALERARRAGAAAGRRFGLGTHLLQDVVADAHPGGVRVLPPELFYPLGPELSLHWFRAGSAARLDELLDPRTRIVHWYASTARARAMQLDAAWVRREVRSVAWARLAAPYL